MFERNLLPVWLAGLGLSEIVLSSVGAFVAIAVTGWTCLFFLNSNDTFFIVGSMGASAVLVFTTPHSRIAQPWPLVMGHFVSVMVGVSCSQFVPDIVLACALAVSGSIFVMMLTNSLHPPGGAAALLCVIGGQSIQELGYLIVLFPVGINVLIMLILAIIINHFIPGRHYPVRND
ncbi:MAG: HPP family protein [Gammaproteobacteria bacterium]|nr:HPP family protein [Gammaproteobacteria bacterium]